LVAHVVFLFGAVAGIEVSKEAVRLPLVHLLEVGHPLLVHLAAPSVFANDYDVIFVQPWCQPKNLVASSESLFTELPGKWILRTCATLCNPSDLARLHNVAG
jgi:hypothetical protein